MKRAGSLATILAMALARCGGDGGTSPNPPLIFAAMEAGYQHTCGVTTAGAGYCWGSNDRGQLGDGTTTTRLRPFLVAGGVTFAAVSVNGHTCALTTADAAHCWGRNDFGQLGVGTTTGPESCTTPSGPFPCSTVPRPVQGTLRFAAVSVGGGHTCAVTAAGAASCWGWNDYGQLGDGTTTTRSTPVLVAAPTGVTFTGVSAGETHSCAVTPTGDAYCWGLNQSGWLGDGTTTTRLSPVLVAAPTGVTFAAVSAARSHTCGVTPAGATYCWGLNGSGQLGNGDAAMATQLTPVLVAAPAGVTFATVSAGDYHTCGLTPGGVAYCWGDGIEGQVGDGATQIRLTPVLVSGGLTFRAVSAGQLHTCGVTPVGAAYCWGSNDLGELGDGTMTNRSSPVLVVQ